MERETTSSRTHHDLADAIRGCLDALSGLDPKTVARLEALAFVLARVADADRMLREAERRRMEEILRDHAALPPDQAVLVVEMARQRRRMADCGRAYGVSRDLRLAADPEQRRHVVSALVAVARADGSICDPERRIIVQLAGELGLSRDDVAEILPTT